MEENVITIDLLDLCRKLLKKWPVLLGCMLIGAILLGGLAFVKATNAPAPIAPMEELRNQLTDSEIEFVESVVAYKNMRDQALETEDAETLYYLTYVFSEMKSEFSANQKALFDALIYPDSVSDVTVQPQVSLTGLVKKAAIGAFIGLFLACCVIALLYIFSKKLRMAKDLEYAYGLYPIADAAELKALLEKKGASSLCTLGLPLAVDGVASAPLGSADAAVLNVKVGKTLYSDIKSYVSACRQFEVPIVGYFAE